MNTCQTATSTTVCFGPSVAYAFDGDEVLLDAALRVSNAGNAYGQGNRYLQLWAQQDNGPAIKLADSHLPVLYPDANGDTCISLRTLAFPPAGQAAYSLSMQLFVQEGDALRLEDQVSFDRQQSFVLPKILGDIATTEAAETLEIQIQGLENPRSNLNVSGTLSLEIWQLNAPYAGGAFSGQRLSRLELGTLAGESSLSAVQLTLPADLPTQGETVLMLREWTAMGDLTRDYRPLNLHKPVSAAEEKEKALEAAVEAVVKVVAEEKPAAKPATVEKPAAKPGQVSVNEATLKQLASVKGLTKKVAEGIVAGRPWTSLDALTTVKGMGEKLLAKIRSALSL